MDACHCFANFDDMDPAGSDDEVPIESPENPLIPHTQNTSSELNQDENSDTSTFSISMDSGLGSPPGNPLDPQAQKTPKELNQDDSLDMSTFGDRIKASCDQLRILLPYIKGRKLDMASILEMSVEYLSMVNMFMPKALQDEIIDCLSKQPGLEPNRFTQKPIKLDQQRLAASTSLAINPDMDRDPRLYRVKCVKLASEVIGDAQVLDDSHLVASRFEPTLAGHAEDGFSSLAEYGTQRYLRSSTTGFGESFTADQNLDRFTMNKPTYNSEETVHPVYSSHTTVNQYYPKYISASDSPKNTEPELGQKPTPDINNNVL
ncbi:uncharacterized protein LOC128223485 [Mya arenaria]|uniref:uncharacterized protein LOC128223485 n=1 Tax=Mya arenaria TaxID=6604 RepID=UPI0022E1088D|nr:uncharacterized protein LOC128223485 [Mya arenaria]